MVSDDFVCDSLGKLETFTLIHHSFLQIFSLQQGYFLFLDSKPEIDYYL